VSPDVEPLDYVLSELSGEQVAEAERLMRDDIGFRAEVERLQPIVAELEALPDDAWELPDPPPLRYSEPERRAGGASGILERLLGRISLPVPAVAAAALALAVGGAYLGSTLGGSGDDRFDGGREIVLTAVSEGVPSTGTAQLSPDGDALRLDVSALEPSTDADIYELWLLTPPGDLVSLGTFKVDEDGAGSVDVPLSLPISDFELLDVSREPLDGDPGHSSDSVLRGNTT
jgi:anti-sigma-K factor RskA